MLPAAGRKPDQLVVAEFQMKDDLRAYRVQWLRPLRPGVFCALGADLSQEFSASRRSQCPAGEDEPDTFTELSFAFTPLLSQARPCVETVLTVSQNSCRGIRGTISTHSFWEATGQSPTLALQLAQSDYRSAGSDTSTREWFTLSSPAPRVAEQFAQVCEVSDTPDGGTNCTTTRTRFDPGYRRQDDLDAGAP